MLVYTQPMSLSYLRSSLLATSLVFLHQLAWLLDMAVEPTGPRKKHMVMTKISSNSSDPEEVERRSAKSSRLSRMNRSQSLTDHCATPNASQALRYSDYHSIEWAGGQVRVWALKCPHPSQAWREQLNTGQVQLQWLGPLNLGIKSWPGNCP